MYRMNWNPWANVKGLEHTYTSSNHTMIVTQAVKRYRALSNCGHNLVCYTIRTTRALTTAAAYGNVCPVVLISNTASILQSTVEMTKCGKNLRFMCLMTASSSGSPLAIR